MFRQYLSDISGDIFPELSKTNLKANLTAKWPSDWLSTIKVNEKARALSDAILEAAWQDYLALKKLIQQRKVKLIHTAIGGHLTDYPRDDLGGGNLEVRIIRGFAIGPIKFRSESYDGICILEGKELLNINNPSAEDKAMVGLAINIPRFDWDLTIAPNKKVSLEKFTLYESSLMLAISNSEHKAVFAIIDAGADVNKYSATEGNTPLLLAVSKGWNHEDMDVESSSPIYPQYKIIKKLFAHKADVNAAHLGNGMTALHIACARGDDPELIRLLISAGANVNAKDYQGRTALDLMKLSYIETQQLVDQLTMSQYEQQDWKNDHRFGGNSKWPVHRSYVATLPVPGERIGNQAQIKQLLLSKQNEAKQEEKTEVFTRKMLGDVIAENYKTTSRFFRKKINSKEIPDPLFLSQSGDPAEIVSEKDVEKHLSGRRLRLFQGKGHPGKTSTDQVIVILRDKFKKR